MKMQSTDTRAPTPLRPTEPVGWGQGASRAPGTAGFTLVELIIVMVLATVILGSTYQILVTNQQIYSSQREQAFAHGTVRAGLEVLTGELREISPEGGDLLDMEADEVEVRTMRTLGFVCRVDAVAVPPRFTLRSTTRDNWAVDQEVLILAENDPNNPWNDVWLEGTITQVAVGDPCPGDSGSEERTRLEVLGLGSLLPPDLGGNLVHRGAPVRTLERHRYGVFTWSGQPFLGRETAGSGDWVPLVGPLADGDGLVLEYFDENGDATTQPLEVRRIDVTLRTVSDSPNMRGGALEQVLTTSIYTRN